MTEPQFGKEWYHAFLSGDQGIFTQEAFFDALDKAEKAMITASKKIEKTPTRELAAITGESLVVLLAAALTGRRLRKAGVPKWQRQLSVGVLIQLSFIRANVQAIRRHSARQTAIMQTLAKRLKIERI